jgi:hypothetical protein
MRFGKKCPHCRRRGTLTTPAVHPLTGKPPLQPVKVCSNCHSIITPDEKVWAPS